MKYPRASGALRWALDPKLKRARFAHMMLLRTIGNLGLSRSGPPLIKSWIRPWITHLKFLEVKCNPTNKNVSPYLVSVLILFKNGQR